MKKKIFTADKWLSIGKALSIAACWGLLLWAIVEIIEGTYRSETAAGIAGATSKLLIGEEEQYPTEGAAYEIEARVVGRNREHGAWYRNVIVANYGDTIEIRLKAMSANPEYVTDEAVYYNGLSVSQTAGLRAAAPGAYEARVMLPDGSFSSYLDNWGSEQVQYYNLGFYKLGLGDWLKGTPASSLRAFNYNGPSATLLVFTPYGEINFWLVFGLLVGAGVCGLIIPKIIQRVRYNLTDYSLEEM